MKSVHSLCQLYAMAHGVQCDGDQSCFYCGAPADGSHRTSDYLKPTFSGLNDVACPGSSVVCSGCVLALRDTAVVEMLDGQQRDMKRIAVRAWSWLVTPTRALAASKAHLSELRGLCLEGPGEQPWGLCLSDSGQKHLLYRGVVNRGGPVWTVTLEGQRVDYRPQDLQSTLGLCGRLVAAGGKPLLAGPVSDRLAVLTIGRYRDGEQLLVRWDRVRDEPLSRLALWLSPKKEDACVEYPGDIVGTEHGPDAACGDGANASGRHRHRGSEKDSRRAGKPARGDDGHGGGDGDQGGVLPFMFDSGQPLR